MIDGKATIREVLMADEVLRELLPNRKVFLKTGDLNGETKMPAITFRDGPSVNMDQRLFQHEIYVRIYDDSQNGTINISQIGRRIVELIHLADLPLRDGRFIQCKLNNTLGELEDPNIRKTFVEYQFRILAL